MNGIEAAGDAMTGAVVAHALEPASGGGAPGAHGRCLNCNARLHGSHCHACGQPAHVHRTLGAIGHEIAHGVFHFEGKIWRTLPMLLLHPGDLTRRYVHGERARFVSPLALFLFCVFLMFAVFESVGLPFQPHVSANDKALTGAEARRQVRDSLPKTKSQVAAIEQARVRAVATKQPTAAIDAALKDKRSDLNGLAVASAYLGDKPDEATFNAGLNKIRVNLGSDGFNAGAKEALANPKLLLYRLQSSAYKFAWALIPLSLPFMWLMFAWHRQYKLYDHAIFVTFSLSFVMLLFVVMALIVAIGLPADWLVLLIPVHFYLQLKGAYRLGRGGALVRTAALLVVTAVVLSLFAMLLVLLGLLG